MDAAFSHGVDALCEAHSSKSAEIAPEMQLIKASVAFGLYVKKSAPELKTAVQTALVSFLNRRVGSWVNQKGGWVSKCLKYESLFCHPISETCCYVLF